MPRDNFNKKFEIKGFCSQISSNARNADREAKEPAFKEMKT